MIIKDGNKAVSDVAYYFSELSAIYPITPSSPMASNIDDLATHHVKNIFNDEVKVVEMQSEAGAAGVMHGALISGTLASTFTSSQGLLLMIPNMYKIAGERLPGVIHVAARSLSTHALSIFGDHQDVYATTKTGFCMLASSSVNNAQYMAAIAHLSAIEGSLPFLHFFDGFRTSHEINTIDEIDLKKIGKLLNQDKVLAFRQNSLNVGHNIQKGMAENEDIYFQSTEARNMAYLKIPTIVNDYMEKINQIAGTDFKPYNYYGDPEAEYLIIAMGSVCDTIRLVIDQERQKGQKYGLIEVHLYRPFAADYLKEVLPETIKNIAVLDRTKEFGSVHEPLCLDVISALKDIDVNIVGGRYGLASKDTSPAQIKSVYTMLETNLVDNFTIGIVDDVTHLSLDVDNDYKLNLNAQEIEVYGFGSDGMVSACKDILKAVFQAKGECGQGYFEYDSKKSGGVTKSSLRFSPTPLKAPFYIDHPLCVVIAKEDYISKFSLIDTIKEKGIVILNTSHENNLNEFLPNHFKKLIQEKHLKLITIDAYKIAQLHNLHGKISMIMEIVILEILGVKNSLNILKQSIKKKFKTKGADVVLNNIAAIEDTLKNVKIIDEDFSFTEEELREDDNLISLIAKKEGNKAKVSDLLAYQEGTFPCNFSANLKDQTSKVVPCWLSENCIQCNMCSLVCPHGVIRPTISEEEGIELLGNKENKKFKLLINASKCTGCGLCIEACPGKKGSKALEFSENKEEKDFITSPNPEIFNKYTVKGSQFLEPKFLYSGACSGCGETAYIKLLTQLLQDDLIIANATGCSSIYGGSVPITPYQIPWANSLFEDNAEFGYGMYLSYQNLRNRVIKIMQKNLNEVSLDVKEQFELFIENKDDYQITREVKKNLESLELPDNLNNYLDYLPSRSVWMIGGDGWAYDIGFGGIDHVLASGENVNILVLDTEVYSNTGGQASKSSSIGQVAEFSDLGKKTLKKDLFKIAMCYPNTYAASVSLGANPAQCLKAYKEAIEHNGPSLIIAYAPCIEQGIKQGMKCSLAEQKALVDCGYLLLMHYDGNSLTIDSAKPDFTKLESVLNNEVRFNALKIKDANLFQELINLHQKYLEERYNYYQNFNK